LQFSWQGRELAFSALVAFCRRSAIAEPYGKMSPRLPEVHSGRYNWEQVTESEPNQTLRAEQFEYLRVEVADEGFITA
jgi:hypothetical protein